MTTTQSDLQDLYRKVIIDHAQQPRNFGVLEGATHSADGINPLCGDKLHLAVVVNTDNTIDDIRFEGSGCAISLASASMLTETLQRRSIVEASALAQTVTARLSGSGETDLCPEIDFQDLRALEGVRQYPARVKCATLAWQTLHAALKNAQSPATTE